MALDHFDQTLLFTWGFFFVTHTPIKESKGLEINIGEGIENEIKEVLLNSSLNSPLELERRGGEN